ncbi:Protein ccc1 [Exophiala xenobiotica]|nr:Protein ccc1 [Exophiala xenobiotica]KAK5202918.1 Protein ccc1 [Exophiala xenobiotica]KAK5219298.1 Protein ccc1 [Exophiala xenobiotica]KAK5311413.1 Protein ccc1 [Exophiala xenobiotica]KAK5344649.1 Protein ccc1 [Exophiala xenobiotica]
MDANGHGNDIEAALGRGGVVVLVPSPAPGPAPASASRQTGMRTAKMKERHKMNGGLLRDFIIGFADGLTVPFALTAGLSSLGSSKLVVTGGLAELFSGAISMGLGAYLATITDKQHYDTERVREKKELQERPAEETEEIYQILCAYGPGRGDVAP